ncbi:hypothetical protein B0H11DRAFT_1739299, partial [Mycena galericulata]
STRNTRVERLWVEVGSQFARHWRSFFLRLERLHQFDPNNPHHLWLLHFLFLEEINKDCEEFQEQWNHHPISGKGHDQTPADMRLIGEVKYGKYADNFENIHPEILERYNQEGHIPMTNTNISTEDLDQAIAQDQDRHIRHEAIDVVQNECPFRTEQAIHIFSAARREIEAREIIPMHLGVAEAEWEERFYPETETIKIGRKEVEIELPFPIWWPRAVAWAQGLELMFEFRLLKTAR